MTKKPDTVVLLHGLAGYGGEWTPFADLLEQSTIPGHGSAERRPADITHAARDSHALDVGPVTLVRRAASPPS